MLDSSMMIERIQAYHIGYVMKKKGKRVLCLQLGDAKPQPVLSQKKCPGEGGAARLSLPRDNLVTFSDTQLI
jgi:hypothetical protein